MIPITIDFETYYNSKEGYSLARGKLTTEEYIRHPSFEVVGLSFKIGDNETKFLPPQSIQKWVDIVEKTYKWENVTCIAHNGMFDFSILSWIYGVQPGALVDTMLISRAIMQWDSNSLANVTKSLAGVYNWGCFLHDGKVKQGVLPVGVVAIEKGTEVYNADTKRYKDFTTDEYLRYANYCKTDVELTYSAYRFFIEVYNFPAKELDVMTTTLEMYTIPKLLIDKKVVTQIQKDILQRRATAIAKAGISENELRSDIKFAEALEILGVKPPEKLNPKGEVKYAFAKTDLEFLELLESENEDVASLVEARLEVKSSHAVSRVERFLQIAQRGALPSPIAYYAGHTGRAGGTDKINMQNLTKNKTVSEKTKQGAYVFYGEELDRFVKPLPENKVFLARSGVVYNDEDLLHEIGLRDAIIAPNGYSLVVNDLSQIECRVSAYIAGEQWVLDAFIDKQDIYKAQASRSLSIAYDDIKKAERFIGKSQTLGLGFQAGVPGLRRVLGVRGKDYDDDTLRFWISSYRQSVPNIVDMWALCQKMLDALITGEHIDLDKKGILKLGKDSIILPNGMKLVYRDIHTREGERGFREYWFWGRESGKSQEDYRMGWVKTFGGKIFENIVQALARIILTDQMLAIKQEFKERGWGKDVAHVCLQVHDELVCCVKDKYAKEVLVIMQEKMAQPPEWARDLPLNSAGDIAKRYGCAK